MRKRGKEKYFIEIYLKHKVGSKESEFSSIVHKYKPMVDLINKGITLFGANLIKNREEVEKLKDELVSELKGTNFIQKIEELTNYDLVDATYVDIGHHNQHGSWVNDEENWGARLFLKYKV